MDMNGTGTLSTPSGGTGELAINPQHFLPVDLMTRIGAV